MEQLLSESDSSSDSDSDVPSAEMCEKLCQEFSTITCTDSAMAMMYLQNCSWTLEQALAKYFEDQGSAEHPPTLSTKKSDNSQIATTENQNKSAAAEEGFSPSLQTRSDNMLSVASKDENPFRICILSWNLDGISDDNTITRTKYACEIMNAIKADIIFLQEVTPITCAILKATMKEYLPIEAGNEHYFTVMLLNRSTVMHESHQIVPFYSSKMGRNFIECDVNIKGIPFNLIASHLESTADHKDERMRQMKKCFEMMNSCPGSRVVVFGGDLNARDKEVAAMSMPNNVVDVWEFCGKRKSAQFTFDTLLNDNLDMGLPFKPRCRFDRFYFRPDEKKTVKAVYFELVGIERHPTCRRFASDHWGILSHYDILK